MAMKMSQKLLIPAVAAACALGLSAPASAGGYYGNVGFHGSYYGGHGGYYGHRGFRGRGYRHRGYHGHRRGGGGKAAAIALGVIGGAIILNEVAENRAERRAYDDRYYDRYDRYSRRSAPRYDRDAFERGYEEGYSRGRSAEGDAPQVTDDGDLDSRLDGARTPGNRNDAPRNDGGPEPIRFSAAEAYQTCITHARAALSERGFMLAAAATPDTADDVGGAWKMTATVSAQNAQGESWSRAMYCEADASRVYLLELI